MILKDVYEPLLISDIAIEKGTLYRSIPSLSKIQNIDNRILRRLEFWINKLDESELKDTIFSYRISYEGKILNRFLFDNLSNVNDIKNNYIRYSSNLAENIVNDFIKFKNVQKNNWRIKDPLQSHFIDSMNKKEYEPLFYIMINKIFGLTKLWKKHALSQSLILDETIKLLENGYTLINSILNLDIIIYDDEFINIIGGI